MARSRRLRLYEFVADLVDLGADVLTTSGRLPAEQSRELMLEIAKAVCFKNAKSTVYIPEAINLANMERNARIWAAYQLDGQAPESARKYSPSRVIELAAAHDLSPQQVYNIIAEQRTDELSLVQPQLTGLDAAA